MKVSLIIVAGGTGSRMGTTVRKPYLCIDGKPIFNYTLETYSKIESINQIVFVANRLDIEMINAEWGSELERFGVTSVVVGGERRQDSVYNGLKHVASDCDIILIHDCVRPFISQEIILQVIDKVEKHGAAIVAVPVKDTVKEVGDEDRTSIKRTVLRANLWAAQTPQGFKREVIMNAFKELHENDFEATDDAQIVEESGCKVEIVHGSYNNIKITTPDDLKIAEAILKL